MPRNLNEIVRSWIRLQYYGTGRGLTSSNPRQQWFSIHSNSAVALSSLFVFLFLCGRSIITQGWGGGRGAGTDSVDTDSALSTSLTLVLWAYCIILYFNTQPRLQEFDATPTVFPLLLCYRSLVYLSTKCRIADWYTYIVLEGREYIFTTFPPPFFPTTSPLPPPLSQWGRHPTEKATCQRWLTIHK